MTTVSISVLPAEADTSEEDIERVKEYLSKALRLGIYIEKLQERLDTLKQKSYSPASPDMSLGTKITSGNFQKDNLYCCTLMLEEGVREQLKLFKETYEDIEAVIRLFPDLTLQSILELRYLQGMHWEDIAYFIGYSLRHVQRKHKEALTYLANMNIEKLK